VGNTEVINVLKVVDTAAVAVVLLWVLRWALKQIEEKDAQLTALANRSADTLETALRMVGKDRRDDNRTSR